MRRALAVLLALAGVACGAAERPSAPPEPLEPSPATAPSTAPPQAPRAAPAASPPAAGKRRAASGDTTGMLGTAITQAALIEQLERAEPLSFKPVGSTSTVFRTKLAESPFEAAFKAATRDRRQGPMAEIGSAAVARCLGVDTVPAAVLRSVPLEFLRQHLEGVSDAQWQEVAARLVTIKNGRVPGALIYWIPDLGDVGLNKDAGLARAREWLRIGGELPIADKSLARSVSVMAGFDYIIGNFDRWSGSNTKGNAAKSSVYVRDHDLALPSHLGEPLHKRLAAQMTMAERVSRGFYAYAQALSPECIEREIARAQPDGPQERLSPKVLAGVLDRRDAFLSHVRALRVLHGDEPVLYFD